jgi:hypothetical protein
MVSRKRKYLYWIGGFILVFFILPNTINFKEREAFSESSRLKESKELIVKNDSVLITPGKYYQRGGFYTFFFGEKNRNLWVTPVKVQLLNSDTLKGGLIPYAIGGSQQTISVRVKDTTGKHWVLRSVNKDQQNALPGPLRYSILRPVFRDQVAAMNPYSPLVVSVLAGAISIAHCHPKLYWVPYNPNYGRYNNTIAGRLVYLEELIDTTWAGSDEYPGADDIVGTDDMEEIHEKNKTPVDTLLYLKIRLFDMLVCDWDRHEAQWRWALVNESGKKIFKPIPKDRDMALYVFDEGILSYLALAINPKFQSFRSGYKNVWGLTKQAGHLDKLILKSVPKKYFLQLAKEIQSQITSTVIERAFKTYPPEIYQLAGKRHRDVLASRLQKLPGAAETFYKLINK